jgi:pimeloyl-ACP methyl ester carboxylesterase
MMTDYKSTLPGTGSYAPVNGLNLYYEIHGEGFPLLLLHGALSATSTSFGPLLPSLSQNHQVIAVELQSHGRTADIDRPLTVTNMAGDVLALLDHLQIERADLFGYSMGASVAMLAAIRHPDRVRKLVLASVSYTSNGVHPGLLEGIQQMTPDQMYGTPFHDEYVQLAPRPDDFPKLFAKVQEMDREVQDLSPEDVQSIQAPVLLMIGDSDIIRPEHSVEMFRLLGGGVAGDIVGLPKSQLAVLPGTTHITIMHRADWLVSMIDAFLRQEELQSV